MTATTARPVEKSLEQVLAGIRTWDTDDFEVSFLSSVCFLIEGEPKEVDAKALTEILAIIDENWFTQLHRRAIFYVIRKIYTDPKGVQFLLPGSIQMMAIQVLQVRGHDKECGLVEMVTTAPSYLYSLDGFMSILPFWRIKLVRKKMMLNAEELIDVFNEQPDPEIILDKVPRLIEAQQDAWNDFSLVNQKRDDWESSVEELLSPLPENVTISTGLKVLDEAIQGGIAARHSAYSGRLTVVAGRPGMGKSTVAICLATRLADSGCDVAFFSLEMSKKQVQYKAFCCYDYFNLSLSSDRSDPLRSDNLRLRRYTEAQRQRLQSYRTAPFVKKFHVYESAENINSISAKVSLLAKTRPRLSAVFIDYLQLIEGCSGDANNTEASNIGHVTRCLKQLAVKIGVDIFLLSQVNRGVEQRTDKMPTMSDLRASGRIEEDADIALLLLRPAYYDETRDPYELAISVAKNRHGACGTLQCNIDLQSSVVFDKLFRGLNV